MNPALCHAGSRIHKISSTLSKVVGEGGHSTSTFYSVKLCVMINFSLRHNVLCFSFVVVLYSMYSLHAKLLKWFSLMKEIVMCNNNLKLKSPLTRSTDHQSLLKHCNFDFAHFLRGVCVWGGGGQLS